MQLSPDAKKVFGSSFQTRPLVLAPKAWPISFMLSAGGGECRSLHVEAAMALDADERKRLKRNSRTSFGKKVEATYTENPRLMGGWSDGRRKNLRRVAFRHAGRL